MVVVTITEDITRHMIENKASNEVSDRGAISTSLKP
jgi:hypothetical protein